MPTKAEREIYKQDQLNKYREFKIQREVDILQREMALQKMLISEKIKK